MLLREVSEPHCEARASGLQIERKPDYVLVEEVVVGCQQPKGGEDEEGVAVEEGWIQGEIVVKNKA